MKNIRARLFGDKFNRRYFAQNAASGICVIIKDGLNLPASLHIIILGCRCFGGLTAGVKKLVKF